MNKKLLTYWLALLPSTVMANSTSPNHVFMNASDEVRFLQTQSLAETSDIITFSEYPLYTAITDQYKNIGIIFGGTNPFITNDSSNNTSPVLSGTPLFQGNITGIFVEPGSNTPTIVESFTFDAGFFDELGSTRVEWFDPAGKKLGQKTNSQLGIERLTIQEGNIASWKMGIVENEPNGYAIDNISFVPLGSSILFREKSDGKKDGTWGLKDDAIPGFDHVGFHTNNTVYESHPGYDAGLYYSADGEEAITIYPSFGVQSQHSRNTFAHDSISTNSTPVIAFEEIPISNELASKMRDSIETVSGATFQRLNFSNIEGILTTLSSTAQKGGNNSFTCIGLVEWAAEQAGHNGGQGFIDSKLESILVKDPRKNAAPDEKIKVPLLSPQLLNYAMKRPKLVKNVHQWVQGLLDPVDFILVDPLGRKMGYTETLGHFNEIPNAFYSGNGGVEQFLIPNPIPGTYKIEYEGIDNNVFVGINSNGSATSFNEFLSSQEKKVQTLYVEPKAGTMGDVDNDGDIDEEDLQILQSQLNSFADGINNAGDINGDGLLSDEDVSLLTELTGILASKITPSVTVNDTSDTITLPQTEPVQLKVSLSVTTEAGKNADWWMAAISPLGVFWYTLDRGFVESATPLAAYAGPLISLTNFPVLENTLLPIGTYSVYFGVDTEMNGILDVEHLVYDGIDIGVVQ